MTVQGLHIALEISDDDRLSVDERIARAVGPFKTGDDARRFAGQQSHTESETSFWTTIKLEAVPA